MKAIAAILSLSCCAFGQDKAAISAAEAACGPRDVRFEVSVDESHHPIPMPENGKAVIYVVSEDPHEGRRRERPFQVREVRTWLRNAGDGVLNLYWLESRPRRQPVVSFATENRHPLPHGRWGKTVAIEAAGHKIPQNTGLLLAIDHP